MATATSRPAKTNAAQAARVPTTRLLWLEISPHQDEKAIHTCYSNDHNGPDRKPKRQANVAVTAGRQPNR
jgi:hypothetical protein